MPISLYLSAYRASPLSQEESSTLDAIFARGHQTRSREAMLAYDIHGEGEQYVSGLGAFSRFTLRGEPPDADGIPILFSGSVKMPSVDRWPVVHDLLQHWCRALSEVRQRIHAHQWRAHLDDFDLRWEETTKSFAAPASLDAAQYRASVDFVRLGKS